VSHHPLILVPRPWSAMDTLRRFGRRKATIPAASWLGELMEQRFGALILCGPCVVKYGDALRRFAYVRHPDMKVQGNVCDACKTVPPGPIALWFKEEHRPPTQNEYAAQSARAGIRSAPHAYDATRRRFACSR
jgi:hypothetical protein